MTALTIRPATADDIAFVVNTWVRTFGPKPRKGWAGDPFVILRTDFVSHNRGKLAPNVWFDMHRDHVADVVKRATILVAEHPDVPGTALGWVAFERDTSQATLHFVYVRKDAQRRGVGKALLGASQVLEADELRASHMTDDGEALMAAAMGPGMESVEEHRIASNRAQREAHRQRAFNRTWGIDS